MINVFKCTLSIYFECYQNVQKNDHHKYQFQSDIVWKKIDKTI